jgi:hypothetical protein
VPFAPHYLLAWGGTLGSAGEIWSNGVRFASVADGDADPDETAVLPAYKNAIVAMMGRGTSKIGPAATLRYVKFNKIDAEGHYVSNTESNTLFTSGPDVKVGNGVGPVHPFSTAVAVTWTTDFSRGRGSKGRIFLPAPCVDINNEGQITASERDGIAVSLSTMISAFNAVNPVPGDAMRAVVASGVNGALNPIKGVSVGSVPDTMRSRRNKLIESRFLAPVA